MTATKPPTPVASVSTAIVAVASSKGEFTHPSDLRLRAICSVSPASGFNLPNFHRERKERREKKKNYDIKTIGAKKRYTKEGGEREFCWLGVIENKGNKEIEKEGILAG